LIDEALLPKDIIMSVFCIANIKIQDLEQYKSSGYLENAAKTITQHSGRYRVRGGNPIMVEGNPDLHRMVIIEFPSMEHFENWYGSEDYAPWKKIRQELSESELYVVEGLSDAESEEIANPV
tara:strand:- start:954 stop:1319 length:366 start_codon:yes stop_codon:yes gene_type:complete